MMSRLGGWSPARRLRAKFVLLALLPLLGALGLMALAVSHQDHELAERERVLVLQTYMNARRVELRHYVDLAVSTVRPLYDSGQTDLATRQQAIQRLASLDYGSDGYFFVYDLDGEVLMHSRQPELLGRNLWGLRDPRGQPTIQHLIAQARNGGGYVEYLWQKPSSGKMVPKLGYVVALPRWHLMLGTGLYLDDMDDTLTQLDQQVRGNISATLWWMLGIAGLALLCLSVSGLWLNLSEQRIADQKLRLLAQRLVRSQEDERARLARQAGEAGRLVELLAAVTAISEGIAPERICVDPGIGFGKTSDHNFALLAATSTIATATGCPVLVGVSRKRFLGDLVGDPQRDRTFASVAAGLAAVERGAWVLRVHDVLAHADALKVLRAVRAGGMVQG